MKLFKAKQLYDKLKININDINDDEMQLHIIDCIESLYTKQLSDCVKIR